MNQKNEFKKLKIGILYSFFWGGGSELMRLIITALSFKSKTLPIEIYVLIPNNSISIKQKIKNLIKKILFNSQQTEVSISKKQALDYLNNINQNNLYFINYDQNKINLNNIIQQHKIDIILPFIGISQQISKIPWIGYIFDFQHKYLQNLFNEQEIKNRNEYFSDVLKKAPAIIVNSKSVKNDILKFYPYIDNKKLFSLPFSPIANPSWLNSQIRFSTIKNKYNIPDSFFMVSNQFWVHKSHITAFKALETLEKKYNIDTNIICTGVMSDNRNPKYFETLKEKINQLSLENKIMIIGHISKEEQIEIMKNSIAVIQPTLFEGGPGGGSVYDAVSLGIPAIISDIRVNKEINNQEVIFFKVQDHNDLAKKMFILIKNKKPNKFDYQYLTNKINENSENLGCSLLSAINFAINHHEQNKNSVI